MSSKKNARSGPQYGHVTTVRFHASTERRLRAVAGLERRSFSNLVEKIVADYLEANAKKNAPIRGKGALK